MEYFSLEEIKTHNNIESCWIVINSKVYDVTSYLKRDLHPGGKEVLLKHAGMDATTIFIDIHSNDAWKFLDQYFIGNVSTISAQGRGSWLLWWWWR